MHFSQLLIGVHTTQTCAHTHTHTHTHARARTHTLIYIPQDTINDYSTVDLPLLHKVQLNVLSKSTGIIVVNGLGITKGFQYWTVG